ncbi:type I-C CRISPR-associated endonuclease Cas1c [Bengtsoniella intestinalis]|uniref:type I-C CRISPR-associated endonuclease Cas1c n=1 Tax=Bengtsoniella intestinalis TaxID=3073143 RepID=UPI00391F60CF
MRHLLNTLFITSEDAYLTLDGENVVVSRGQQEMGRFPLHTLSAILSFSYAGASPALMGACGSRQINLTFCSPRGRFLARVSGQSQGNVLLRRTQYRMADDPFQSCNLATMFIQGKIYNARQVIARTRRDHPMRVDESTLLAACDTLKELQGQVAQAESLDSLRGLEGVAASTYFGVFDHLILNEKETFYFHGRNRRPPLDAVNALLSFAYSILAGDCASALESVGLDAYVGFLHRDKPGRTSLALDLMEELRAPMADRFVLTLINNRMISPDAFQVRESGAVLLSDAGRKLFLQQWQKKKQEQITHPFLEEKIPWGLVPYMQALLLARYLRGDLDGYPPFLWK